MALRHHKGRIVYGMASFTGIFYFLFILYLFIFIAMSSGHVIMNIKTVYTEAPHCLKYAFDYYLGLSSVVCPSHSRTLS